MDEKLRFDKFGPDCAGSVVGNMLVEVQKVNEAKAAKDLPSAAVHEEAARAHFNVVKEAALKEPDQFAIPTNPDVVKLAAKAADATIKAWKHDNLLKPFVKALQ